MATPETRGSISVPHDDHGHPEENLTEELGAVFEDIAYPYVEQCGCIGHVTRVHVA